jgi:two-component system response regulator ChvI
MRPIRALLVEDDLDYRQALADELSDHGFSVRSFSDGAALLASLAVAADTDVIVLDWVLPGISGIVLLSQLRQRGVTLPVVFVTGYSNVECENQALAQGARDFIDKSRGVEIVAIRLRRIVESAIAEGGLDQGLVSGKLVLNPSVNRAYWGDADVNLTLTEYKVVELLASNTGHYLTYRAIFARIRYKGFIAGSGGEGYRTNVRSVMKRIRRKFCELDPTFGQIQTSATFGYRWLQDELGGELGAAG